MLRQVTTKNGVLQGVPAGDPRITVFKGVPYAKPPVGELRWRSPQPVEPWDGVRMADRWPDMAWQGQPGSDPTEFWTRELNPTATEYTMSEDCLYLNIWTPAKAATEHLPVFLWFHGGGLQAGYAYEMEFDGEKVCREDVIFATVGYRLNVFGFLAHPELTAEDPDAPHGNYALEDVTCAIRWLRENIAAFGGDPDRITVGGQSGGANGVLALMCSPMTEGLLAGAITQSGGGLRALGYGSACTPLQEAEDEGKRFFETLGVKTLAEARAKSAAEVYAACKATPGAWGSPRIDGRFLLEDLLDCMVNDRHHRIPYLFGNTAGEGPGTPAAAPLPKSFEAFRAMAEGVFGDETDAFLAHFGIQTLEDALAMCHRDAFNARMVGTRAYCRHNAQFGRPNEYCYLFNHDIPGEDHPGAYHGSDMWFTFNSLARCWRPFEGKHYDLARKAVKYWTNFVKHGNPNGLDQDGTPLPEWKAYTAEDPFVMEFTDQPGRETRPQDEALTYRLDYQFKKYGL